MKNSFLSIVMGVIFASLPFCVSGKGLPQQHSPLATSAEELNTILKSADRADTIYVANGTYDQFKVTIAASGEKDKPLVIMAETPGSVIFADNTAFKITGNYVVLNGFYFQDPGDKDTGSIILIRGDHNRVTQCAFWKCHNRVSVSSTYQNDDKRIPKYTMVDHCYFADNMGRFLYLDLGKTPPSASLDYTMYYRVSHCYFSTPFKLGENTGASMRIGLGDQAAYGRCLIDNNLFERQNAEAELIENKSTENIYINNTFKNCESDMSFRQGHRTVFLHNHLIGTDPKAPSGGLSMWMDGSIIAGNYFSFPYGSYIPLKADMTPRSERSPAAVVRFNCGHLNYKRPTGGTSTHLSAQNNLFTNNLFNNCSNYLFNLIYFKYSLSQRKFRPDGSEPHHNTIINNDVIGSGINPKNYMYKDNDVNKAENKIETPNFLTAASPILNIPPYEQKHQILAEMQVWLETETPGGNKDYDLQKLADTKPATLSVSGDAISVKLASEPLSFEDVGPTWLRKNPSKFATRGYTRSTIKEVRSTITFEQ